MLETVHSYKNPLYNTWKDMHKRCGNKNRRDYKWYGAKGITVCVEWSTFQGFLQDMLSTYSKGNTLDRIDNTKGYCKNNCRWSSISKQQENRSNVKGLWLQREKMLELVATGMTHQQIANHLGCSQPSVTRILKWGR